MKALSSFFIASGTNLGDRLGNLQRAKDHLKTHFQLIAESRIYESPAVDYLTQPDFYNQVLEFLIPNDTPDNVMNLLLSIEGLMGRNRLIPKGPRIIDLDILFWGVETFQTNLVAIPHPRLFERSFVVFPLSELPGFKILSINYNFNFQLGNVATPLS